jgi:hypothetical protein
MLPFPSAAHRQEPETLELAPLPSAIIVVSLDAPWRQESDVVSWNHAHLQGGEYHWIHWNREQKSPKCLHAKRATCVSSRYGLPPVMAELLTSQPRSGHTGTAICTHLAVKFALIPCLLRRAVDNHGLAAEQ